MASVPLWPRGLEITHLGITGGHGSGKTLFGLSIHPQQTLSYDVEMGQLSYRKLGFEHVNLAQLLNDKYPNGYTNGQAFQYWWNHVEKIQPGQYSVIFVDPVSSLEAGQVDVVTSQFDQYGFSSPEKFRATGGLFWGKVKEDWEYRLLKIASKCQTFCFTTHLGRVWRGKEPTDLTKPKGKSTLLQLATLYLELERVADPATGTIQAVPSGIVVKERLGDSQVKEDEEQDDFVNVQVSIEAYLPDRLPRATPYDLRQYLRTPLNRAALSDDEKIQPRLLSEDDKLAMQARIAEDNRAAEEAARDRLQTRQAMEAAHQKAVEQALAAEQARKECEGWTNRDAKLSDLASLKELLVEKKAEKRFEDWMKKRYRLESFSWEDSIRITREDYDMIYKLVSSL